MKELITFKKQRELGEIITDTFKFLRLEYKPLFKALLRNAAIPFLILIGISAYYTGISTDFDMFSNDMFNAANIILPLIGLFIAVFFYYGILYGTILNFIKLYIKNQGDVDQDELKSLVRRDLGNLTGLTFLIAIMIFFGFMLCFFPGVYVAVPLSLTWAILVFQNQSVGDSISDSFRLVKDEWWITFATMFVLGLLMWVASFVFSLPALIYTITKGLTSAEQISQGDLSSMFDWVYILLNVLSSAVQYILAGIFAIAIAFIYFNLNEKKNQTGTFETIESIGSDND
ncbi:hypothetical protein [Leeuwenhoekiella marinoflava]|uniref:Glycerophosphoryl diester phosphodiesterase family protein n=2 Tax=Leeuwenhoekiella marinoflava TaxID=988 RepID=A0A4Q0PK25_9FLAO|nr:hypothetical protein [Leeuwenhoekiella marinoflava]RXG27236.1 hypothetical protein DSL99_3028 [Leeuwenhoekiella marinoflava]SHF79542.1 hypothetical protein SAMN02745246_03423 [Leeuwenhoekiella marinoflava DSM 3653]